MQTKFNGNYIKRISYYVGIIAFVAYLIIALVMWIMDINKEVDNIVNNAKAELAPLIQWYEKDSARELERYRNITYEELNKIDVDSLIEQTLQDIKTIISNIEILTNFTLSYGDENGAKEFSYAGARTIGAKLQIILFLLDRERTFNPDNTYYILNNKHRTQSFLDFQHFLELQIKNNFLDSNKREKASLNRIIAYYNPIHIYYFSLAIFLISTDIEENTCDIDETIIRNVFSQYEFLKKNTSLLLDIFDKKDPEPLSLEQKLSIKNELNNFMESVNKKEATIATIQSNLKECQ
ncbi:hypothetical protein [Helicobacter hepaticus]|jgi:hypothetical protein|uniref:Uncharacterized protein n=1 Tax=Helicobacter hepaticus (strain ATCC 51449 / 3B1) TaxID=235279 RepID=Q7VJ40_HELHP|nr:hypothetical protein [Helicobacter hepaticus]AAP77000.1 hypothetical protein HH_0403 [Helicobacter hepaticus ATCC 51449]